MENQLFLAVLVWLSLAFMSSRGGWYCTASTLLIWCYACCNYLISSRFRVKERGHCNIDDVKWWMSLIIYIMVWIIFQFFLWLLFYLNCLAISILESSTELPIQSELYCPEWSHISTALCKTRVKWCDSFSSPNSLYAIHRRRVGQSFTRSLSHHSCFNDIGWMRQGCAN